LRVIPIGTSIRPFSFISPIIVKTFVPDEPSTPRFLNQSAPLRRICGTFAKVSTLFTIVGFPKSPETGGYGGFNLGSPLFPSIDSISAVSSPQT